MGQQRRLPAHVRRTLLGNSAIEAALLLMPHNRVTLSYRGEVLFRAKEENRRQIAQAEKEGRLTILYKSNVKAIRDYEVDIDVDGELHVLANDHVILQIGTLPPVDFLMDMGLELDGVRTKKRGVMSIIGLLIGAFIYFQAKHFVLRPEAAGEGKLLLPGLSWLSGTTVLGFLGFLGSTVLPGAWLGMLAAKLINANLGARGRGPLTRLQHANTWLIGGALVYAGSLVAPSVLTVDPAQAGDGPYCLPGLAWMYHVVPQYFTNLYGFYYLLYFSAITGFGLYWAYRSGHWLVWRRNLTIIASQWTLWWGIPTFMAVFLGRNAFTPLISRSLNAWPLNMSAFKLDPAVGPGDRAWWPYRRRHRSRVGGRPDVHRHPTGNDSLGKDLLLVHLFVRRAGGNGWQQLPASRTKGRLASQAGEDRLRVHCVSQRRDDRRSVWPRRAAGTL